MHNVGIGITQALKSTAVFPSLPRKQPNTFFARTHLTQLTKGTKSCSADVAQDFNNQRKSCNTGL